MFLEKFLQHLEQKYREGNDRHIPYQLRPLVWAHDYLTNFYHPLGGRKK